MSETQAESVPKQTQPEAELREVDAIVTQHLKLKMAAGYTEKELRQNVEEALQTGPVTIFNDDGDPVMDLPEDCSIAVRVLGVSEAKL